MSVIVAAIDFSELSEKVLATASQLARESASSLHLLHVAAPKPNFTDWEGGSQWVHNYTAESMKEVRDYRDQLYKEEQERLNTMAENLQKDGIDAQAFLEEGPPVETILEHVQKYNTRMLVIGSHGHGVFYHMIAGSVTVDLLKKTTVPVVVESQYATVPA